MIPMEIVCTIVEDTGVKEYQGIAYRYFIVRYEGRLLKIKADKALDGKEYLDREVTLKCEIRGTASQAAGLKAVAIEASGF